MDTSFERGASLEFLFLPTIFADAGPRTRRVRFEATCDSTHAFEGDATPESCATGSEVPSEVIDSFLGQIGDTDGCFEIRL